VGVDLITEVIVEVLRELLRGGLFDAPGKFLSAYPSLGTHKNLML
jgi:hypothetical protein